MKIVICISLISLFACGNKGGNRSDDLMTIEKKRSFNQDSLAEIAKNAADRMREDGEAQSGKSEEGPKIVVTKDLGWQANKNLNVVRVLSITNNSEKIIIGVFLKSKIKSGNKITDARDFGKFTFEVPLDAHKTKTIRIPASRIGRDIEAVLNSNAPSWAGLVIKETILVKTVIFDDGSFSSINE
ncbi:MAG: hypothetical protein ACRYFK_09060 [Janthinobacterium lividum]